MALTVNLKPSGFQPVGGGSLIYQFTEASVVGKPNYRVELEFNGLGIPKFEFRPDASLIVRCDIAPILASTLKLAIATADRLKNTYVRYQAIWDGGSDAQVNLTTDVIYYYIGNNHILNRRTKFHTTSTDGNATATLSTGVVLHHDLSVKTNDMVAETVNMIGWINREIRFDFLHDNTLPASSRLRVNFVNRATLAVTNTNYNFTGNVFALESITHTFTAEGWAFIFIENTTSTTFYKRMVVRVYEECSNPVYLRWTNDYGGIAYWMFDFNHNLSLIPDTEQKYLTKKLTEINSNYQQWLMLNEINKNGTIYNDKYRLGQFLQDFTVSASPEDVISLPSNSRNETAARKTVFEVSIRYPEIPNNRITV